MAEQSLRERFGAEVCDHHIHAIVSDGDLEEGVSHEAASLAGHLRLGRMVYVYDDNHISIDGPTEIALTDDPVKRFEAYGWHVQDLGEASEDLDAMEQALRAAAARSRSVRASSCCGATSATRHRPTPTTQRPTASPSAPRTSPRPRR